jgi:hypothetical protein
MTGPRISADPDEAFLGIFETLNWAVAVDNRLRTHVRRSWASSYPDGDVLAGFRYARNAVNHDWAEALELTAGVVLPTPLPAGLFEWRWRGELSATRPSGKTQYKGRLAQQPVRFTLEALGNLYGAALNDFSGVG